MNRKYRNTFRTITLVMAGTALASVAVLWSWNTLAPLFGGPTIEVRHALAVIIALVVLRVGLGRGLGARRRVTEPGVRP